MGTAPRVKAHPATSPPPASSPRAVCRGAHAALLEIRAAATQRRPSHRNTHDRRSPRTAPVGTSSRSPAAVQHPWRPLHPHPRCSIGDHDCTHATCTLDCSRSLHFR
eukprot:863859-Prymnesium_polylepis.2